MSVLTACSSQEVSTQETDVEETVSEADQAKAYYEACPDNPYAQI